MLPISDSELSDMRDTLETLALPGTAIIKSPTYTSDGAGGNDVSYAVISGGTVSARLDPLRKGREGEVYAGQEGLTNLYQLTVPYDATLNPDYRVTFDGIDYEIRELHINNSWALDKRAIVAKVE